MPFFFFNGTPTTEIYTLSLHDALPISSSTSTAAFQSCKRISAAPASYSAVSRIDDVGAAVRILRKWSDRKSTRLNSSHTVSSYAVFCLKKKNTQSKGENLSCDTRRLDP